MNDQLTQIIQDITSKLGTTVTEFWPTYVNYTRTIHSLGITQASIWIILSLVVFTLGTIFLLKNYKKDMGDTAPLKCFLRVSFRCLHDVH